MINRGVVNVTEFLAVYSKRHSQWNPNRVFRKKERDDRYISFITNVDDNYENWEFSTVLDAFALELCIEKSKLKKTLKLDYDKKLEEFYYTNSKRIFRFVALDDNAVSDKVVQLKKISKDDPNKVYLLEREDKANCYLYKGQAILFFEERLVEVDGEKVFAELLTDIWDDVLPNDLHNEGGVSLKKGKKPEKFIQRILQLFSNENEIVLDYHLGSGTTCAVAHKLKRRYIGIEQLNYEENDSVVRVNNVIKGEQSGISKAVNWQGGGNFIYAELSKSNQQYIEDIEKAKNILIVAPGLTVRNRLSVLYPSDKQNYYEEFNIVSQGLMESLRQGKIKIINWHTLAWDTQQKLDDKISKGNLRTVDKRKRTEISDEAYVKEVLGDLATATNLLIINDEAHHAWRVPSESKIKGVKKEDIEESTVWVGGLDKIHRSRGILQCFDLSATPFAPSGKKATEEALFPWIVSNFGLNDAIESGLVKTPRVVIRDDGSVTKELRSKLYHIYAAEVEGAKISIDLNQKVDESIPLPDLVRNAYVLLGKDWKATKDDWEKAGYKIPPAMITVASTTYASARIKYSFDHDSYMLSAVGLGDLCNPDKTLQIDSSILNKVEKGEFGEIDVDEAELETESEEEEENDVDIEESDEDTPKEIKKTKKQLALELRAKVNTVGRIGEPGEQIQNIISVGMLSEGWDARTVTHIMGLRAFTSQLLCEQVVGRGLRRTEYEVNPETGLFEPEYVNIFGVPFTFLPHEDAGEGTLPPTPKAKTEIKAAKEKSTHEISFPNVLRIDHIYKPQLTIDIEKVKPLELDPYSSITEAELGAIIASKPSNLSISGIDLIEVGMNTRMQTIIFKAASAIYNSEKKPDWKGSKETFLIQLMGIVEKFIYSDKIRIKNPLFNQDEVRKRILLMLNMNKVIQYIWNEIRAVNTTQLTPIFDKEHPIRSTHDIRTWWTSKKCEPFDKSHINFVVCDSTWEFLEARTINDSKVVKSFVKNDHLGFAIIYNYQGIVNRYFPDFIIKLTTGENLIIETKGQDKDKDKTKRAFLDEWCRAVNQHGGFGKWSWAVSFNPNDFEEKIINATNKEEAIHL